MPAVAGVAWRADPLLDQPREIRHDGRLEHVPHAHVGPGERGDPPGQLRRQQRVAAEVEEVVVGPDALESEKFPVGVGHQVVERTARGRAESIDGCGFRQRGDVQLAVDGARQGRQLHQRGGNHVVGQHAAQIADQPSRVEGGGRFGSVVPDHVCHQPVVADEHRRRRHLRQPGECRAHLPGSMRWPRSCS